MVDLSENALDEQENTTALSPVERTRLRELVGIVNRGLTQFLEVGRALLAIRTERLYRETRDNFEQFCRDTFGLGRSTCDHLVRSTQTAELLIANGACLPEGASESTIRPISTIPDPELQVATWDLAQAASPQNGPTKTVVSKVARAVKTAICRCVSERKRTVAKYFQTQIPAGRIAVFAPYPETLHVGRV